jgi:hypothetical protein
VHLMRGAFTYVPWLWWEIAKSAWAVTKIILHPRLPISPTMTKVVASQKTAVGIATYANSITLTPGTITTGVKGHVLTVAISPMTRRRKHCDAARAGYREQAANLTDRLGAGIGAVATHATTGSSQLPQSSGGASLFVRGGGFQPRLSRVCAVFFLAWTLSILGRTCNVRRIRAGSPLTGPLLLC